MKTMDELVDLSRRVAVDAHDGILDKSGNPYIDHIFRVAERVEDPKEKMVAYLHDALEDTPVNEEDLRYLGFPDDVIKAVVVISKDNGENYDRYISHVAKNPLATAVKLADLEDNLGRIESAPQDLRQRKEKTYRSAKEYLTKVAREMATSNIAA